MATFCILHFGCEQLSFFGNFVGKCHSFCRWLFISFASCILASDSELCSYLIVNRNLKFLQNFISLVVINKQIKTQHTVVVLTNVPLRFTSVRTYLAAVAMFLSRMFASRTTLQNSRLNPICFIIYFVYLKQKRCLPATTSPPKRL